MGDTSDPLGSDLAALAAVVLGSCRQLKEAMVQIVKK
jgi:hypothetical protein